MIYQSMPNTTILLRSIMGNNGERKERGGWTGANTNRTWMILNM